MQAWLSCRDRLLVKSAEIGAMSLSSNQSGQPRMTTDMCRLYLRVDASVIATVVLAIKLPAPSLPTLTKITLSALSFVSLPCLFLFPQCHPYTFTILISISTFNCSFTRHLGIVLHLKKIHVYLSLCRSLAIVGKRLERHLTTHVQ